MIDTGHWEILEGVEINEETFGFIYLITNSLNGKKYIGKKQKLTKLKRKPLKGKKNKRISIIDTDWKTYTGSSNELNADIEKFGKQNFTFVILKACGSKWELAFEEAKMQIQCEVLLREDYYNGMLNLRVGKAPKDFLVSYSKEHK